MAEHTSAEAARTAAAALPLALRELDTAEAEREFIANRAGVAKLTLTFDVPGSLPQHFHLRGEAAESVKALLPGLASEKVVEARARVRGLTDQIRASAPDA